MRVMRVTWHLGKRNASRRLLLLNPAARSKRDEKFEKENAPRARISKDDLYENRDKALERVFALCEKYEGSDEQAEELDKALDVLAVAQITLTLDFASGCLSS